MNEWPNVVAAILTLPLLAAVPATAPRRTVEVRSYNLKAGARPEFHRLASDVAVPMLRRSKIDVLAYGPSAHDETSYYLIRAFASPADRERSEEAFYGSDEWKNGPRERVLALIESYTTVVLELDAATIEGLRRP
jgi:hypothetical protein